MRFGVTPPLSTSRSPYWRVYLYLICFTYAQGTGLPSLSLTLLLVAALLVKRKVSENRKLLLSVLCVVLMSGLRYN
ncbi:hypothetical protein NDU88_005416 [Pleurodeles waltl]|uniref:Uncharacterized protein n=1 Tax=Pleurodeles waltl TaxID=8319 RepID=A0AAV7TBA2_PLEWA|nr:hypothetical protein NDU88_005416 [Pleurodeles waltl]